jgi:hypothetical protein
LAPPSIHNILARLYHLSIVTLTNNLVLYEVCHWLLIKIDNDLGSGDHYGILTVICDGEIATFTVLASPAFMSDSRSKFTSLIFGAGTVAFCVVIKINVEAISDYAIYSQDRSTLKDM